MGTTAAIIIIRKEKDLVSHFQQAQAVSLATAQSLGALGVGDGTALRRLRSRAVIREASPGTFYLDEPSWLALGRTRRRLILIALLIVVGLGIATALTGRGLISF
jgi:hypothetical protein